MTRWIKGVAWGFLGWAALFSTAMAQTRIPVFVSILPQKYFVEQVGKERVEVRVMVPPGASPHTYEPKPRQMAAVSGARAYFAVGVIFEEVWLDKIRASNPAMRVVHTDHGITKLPMAFHDHHDGEKHPEKTDSPENRKHETDHGARDPHIWLSPPLVVIQARNILKGLQEVDPEHAAFYAANCRAFISMVESLDQELRHVFADLKGRAFMVFHPSWGYFAHAYGLKQVPVEIEGKHPKPAQLKALIDYARAHRVQVVFAQPQFSSKSAEQVAREIGGRVAFADPMPLNWADHLREMAAAFREAAR